MYYSYFYYVEMGYFQNCFWPSPSAWLKLYLNYQSAITQKLFYFSDDFLLSSHIIIYFGDMLEVCDLVVKLT